MTLCLYMAMGKVFPFKVWFNWSCACAGLSVRALPSSSNLSASTLKVIANIHTSTHVPPTRLPPNISHSFLNSPLSLLLPPGCDPLLLVSLSPDIFLKTMIPLPLNPSHLCQSQNYHMNFLVKFHTSPFDIFDLIALLIPILLNCYMSSNM